MKPTTINLNKFLEALQELSPIDFLGVATYLKIDCYEDEERKNPKTAEMLVYEVAVAYTELSRADRRALLKLVKEARMHGN